MNKRTRRLFDTLQQLSSHCRDENHFDCLFIVRGYSYTRNHTSAAAAARDLIVGRVKRSVIPKSVRPSGTKGRVGEKRKGEEGEKRGEITDPVEVEREGGYNMIKRGREDTG